MKNTSTITKKGQVTIPKNIRDKLDLQSNQKVSFVREGDKIIVRPITPISNLAGSLKKKGRNKTRNLAEIRQKVQSSVAQNSVKEMEG